MFDGPGTNVVALGALSSLYANKVAEGVTSLTATYHFETYLVYKGEPIYRICWTSSSTLTKLVDNPPPPVTTVVKEGSGPTDWLRNSQYGLLTDKFGKQSVIKVPVLLPPDN